MHIKHDPYYHAYLEMLERRAVEDHIGRIDRWKPKLDYTNQLAVVKHNHLTRLLAYTSGGVEGVRTFQAVPCHPTVLTALEAFGSPKDWHLLVLEQPQVSSDGRRVAYVRNEDKRQAHYKSDDPTNPYLTATTPSKYITRHWPHVRSDKIRDLCEAQTHKFAFADDIEEMIEIVIDGTSYSCMQDFRPESHPYQVYDPKFGWKLAYAERDGRLVARALVNDEYKCFVRTYGKENGQGDTQSHPGLHHFLVSQGYEYLTAWPEGCRFAKLKDGGEWLAPFLDPGADRIESCDSRRVTDAGGYFERSDSGEFVWDNTDGTATSTETETCDECGESVDGDECTWVGERRLCESCLCDGYVYVQTVRGESEYIPNSDAVCVDGECYHPDYLDRHDIVQLETGHYAHIDNTVYVEDEGYYHEDEVAYKPFHSGCVVLVGDDYRLRSECVWCEYGDKWIDQDDAIQVPDGGHIEQGYFDAYILQLERDDVIKACEFCEEDVGTYLAIWDAHYAANEAQAALI